MLQQILSIAKALSGKHVNPALKTIMSIIFVGGVTSFLFSSIYFDYELADIRNLPLIFDFVFKGQFIVPFSIFFIIWTVSEYAALIVFKFGNYCIKRALYGDIVEFSFSELPSSNVEAALKASSDGGYAEGFLIEAFRKIGRLLSELDAQQLRKLTISLQDDLEEDFVLMMRAILAIIAFYIQVEFFGWVLFTLVIVSALFYVFLLFIMYQLAEITPILLAVPVSNIEKTIVEEQKQIEKAPFILE